MKEFIEKLIGRLEEEIQDVSESQRSYEVGSDMSITCSHIMGTLRDVKNRIIPKLAEEHKDKLDDEWQIIYNIILNLEKKYANDGNTESVNDCIKLENLLQYFKEELRSEEEYINTSTDTSGGWIPCSERLPSEEGKYLVTVKNLTGHWIMKENVFVCGYYYNDFIFQGWEDNEVIAWQPLPAPYISEKAELKDKVMKHFTNVE